MSHAFPLSSSAVAAPLSVHGSRRRVPASVLQGLMAVALLGMLGSGSINAMPAAAAAAPVTDLRAVEVPEVPAVLTVDRCAGCGLVTSIRHIEAAGAVPAAYEFTVRMRDGSVRTSSDTSAGNWIVGDRIILVGGS
jgi:hypothetical protein